MNHLLYGVAYYDEYMPVERLHEDIEMMKAAGINTVRIAESTWSTLEPQSGIFDFTSIDRVLAAMHAAGIHVIVGTPTYAVPTWLVREHPEVLARTPRGEGKYGPRQIMDITHPSYLMHAERVIRKLIAHVCDHPAVIGYQADNETKHYGTCGPNVQTRFVKYMRETFGDLETINREFGLDYWSNRINAWEDFPSMEATINQSLMGEFSRFQRKLVTDFLAWQVSLIDEYRRPGQFITQNFDYEWRGYSFGVQPDVDQFEAAEAFDVAGVDIYHPSQDQLTGREIGFGGDIARSLKKKNYYVIETEAQAFPTWTPYPGQLRLQAFSHLASGADMVAYWHWHSTHNAIETYWKGLLGQDFEPNATYLEAKTIGADFRRLGDRLIHLKKKNRIAMLVSNEALTAIHNFKYIIGTGYNDIVRAFYDALFDLNAECDFVSASRPDGLEDYAMIVVPALYAAPDSLLERLDGYCAAGGRLVVSCLSGFSNEHVKVRHTRQPGILHKALGAHYSQFVQAARVPFDGNPFEVPAEASHVDGWLELVTPDTAETVAKVAHPAWGAYAAVTRNAYGKGSATYVASLPAKPALTALLRQELALAGLAGAAQQLAFPLIARSGANQAGRTVRYVFNYSGDAQSFVWPFGAGEELLAGKPVAAGEAVQLPAWGFMIVEEAPAG